MSDTQTLDYLHGWIDAHAAQRHLGIGSLSAVYRLIDEHRLPHGRLGRIYRFRRHDLDRWIERHGDVVSLVTRRA